MCGRFTAVDVKAIYEKYELSDRLPSLQPSYNIAPSHEIPAIVGTNEGNRLLMLRWGLIPSWSKDDSFAFKMINARAETIDQKPSFKNLLTRRRCLIPADGFFEWKKEEKSKTPYRFILENEKPFAFAGLWDSWKNEKGETLYTFTIVTTSPNKMIEEVHDRMPVILNDQGEKIWLDPNTEDKKVLKELLIPYPSELMDKYQVSSYVNSSRNPGPKAIERVSSS